MRSKKAPFMDLSRRLLSRIKSFSNDLFRNLSKARYCPELVVYFEFPRDKSPNITIKIRTDISHPQLISPRNTATAVTASHIHRRSDRKQTKQNQPLFYIHLSSFPLLLCSGKLSQVKCFIMVSIWSCNWFL